MRTALTSILLLAVLLTTGCSKKEAENAPASKGTTGAANVAEVAGVEVREGRVPNFTWKDASGQTVSFDSYRGKVTLVNFWATWCAPCKKELPDLIAISKEMADKGVKIIGISTDRGLSVMSDVSTFVTEAGIPYQIIIASDDLESAFGNIRMIPATFLVDANGTIVKSMVGMHSKEAFVQAINASLP